MLKTAGMRDLALAEAEDKNLFIRCWGSSGSGQDAELHRSRAEALGGYERK